MYENKQVMDIQIYPGGCGMNFVLIAIILLALLFLFSLEVLIFCLIFLLLRNFTKIRNNQCFIISLISTILISITLL
jgi:hypothetical protein